MKATHIFLAAALTALAAGCGGGSEQSGGGLTVVATTTIIGDVAANVAGDDATVVTLMPVGVDPHDFRPSAAQVAAINRADLVVSNGLQLEEGMEDVLSAAADDGIRVMALAPLVEPLPFGSGNHDGDASYDPHVWLDPLRMADAARLIASQLAELDPTKSWTARADAYARELASVDSAIRSRLASIPDGDRRIVTNHDSLAYFAARYDLVVVGTVIPAGSTLADPSSQQLADLIDTMRREGVSAIFAETTLPSSLADALAAELGTAVEVVSLYTGSLGEPGSGAETLADMLTTNADRIADALA